MFPSPAYYISNHSLWCTGITAIKHLFAMQPSGQELLLLGGSSSVSLTLISAEMGWEENHVEVIIKIETQRDSCKLHTLTAAFVGGCQAGITQHSLTRVLSAHFLCWSQSWI